LRDRLLAHFLALAEEGQERMQGPEQQEWLDRFETEHENLRAALAWSSSGSRNAIACLRLSGALARFWRVRGYYREGREWYAAALRLADCTAAEALGLAADEGPPEHGTRNSE